MRLTKPQPLLFQSIPLQRGKLAEMGFAVGLGFRLSDPRVLKHEARVWQAANAVAATVPLYELARPKRQAEWLLAGHTVCRVDAAQAGRPAEWTAQVRLHDNAKTVSAKSVAWRDPSGRDMARLKVDHAQAHCGTSGANPFGCAQLDAPLQAVDWKGARNDPMAGMGPIDSRWPHQMAWAPTFAKTLEGMAAEGSHKGWPANVDLRFFQQALPDQWSKERAWPNGAPFSLRGFSAVTFEVSGALPRLQVQLAIRRKGTQVPERVALSQQTVWFLPDADTAVMWWWGAAPLKHLLDDAIELAACALHTMEAAADDAQLMALADSRVHPDKADPFLVSDFPLMPALDEGWVWEQAPGLDEDLSDGHGLTVADLRGQLEKAQQDIARMVALKAQRFEEDVEAVPDVRDPELGKALAADFRTVAYKSGKQEVKDQTISRQDLTGLSFKGWVFENVQFEHCDFGQAAFEDCAFSQVILDSCRFKATQWRRVHGKDLGFKQCLLSDSQWFECALEHTHLNDCVLDGAVFQRAALSHVHGQGGGWSALHIEDAVLDAVSFVKVKAPRAWLWKGVQSAGVSLTECALVGAAFDYCKFSKLSVVKTDLSRSSWKQCRFNSVSMVEDSAIGHSRWSDCELTNPCWMGLQAEHLEVDHCTFKQLNAQGLASSHSRWRHTILTDANFLNAQLQGSLFERSSLKSAVLVGAELRQSFVQHCNLIRADLTESTLPDSGAWHSNLEAGCIAVPRRHA